MERFTKNFIGLLRSKKGTSLYFLPYAFPILCSDKCSVLLVDYVYRLSETYAWQRRGTLLQSTISRWFSWCAFRQPFFVTIFIIRHAIHAERDVQYITHLSLDLVIAILATFWVVFVFSFSGWIVQFWEPIQHVHQDLVNRNEEYTEMLVDALERPTDNKRNIYFGLIMGVSAILPTCCHISMFLMSLYRTMFLRKT